MKRQEALVAIAKMMADDRSCGHERCNNYRDAFDRNLKAHGSEVMDWDFEGFLALGVLLEKMQDEIDDGMRTLGQVLVTMFPAEYKTQISKLFPETGQPTTGTKH